MNKKLCFVVLLNTLSTLWCMQQAQKQNVYGDTPLIVATRVGNVPLVQQLLSQGEDASVPNKFSRTPLWYAQRNIQREGGQKLVELFKAKQPQLYLHLLPQELIAYLAYFVFQNGGGDRKIKYFFQELSSRCFDPKNPCNTQVANCRNFVQMWNGLQCNIKALLQVDSYTPRFITAKGVNSEVCVFDAETGDRLNVFPATKWYAIARDRLYAQADEGLVASDCFSGQRIGFTPFSKEECVNRFCSFDGNSLYWLSRTTMDTYELDVINLRENKLTMSINLNRDYVGSIVDSPNYLVLRLRVFNDDNIKYSLEVYEKHNGSIVYKGSIPLKNDINLSFCPKTTHIHNDCLFVKGVCPNTLYFFSLKLLKCLGEQSIDAGPKTFLLNQNRMYTITFCNDLRMYDLSDFENTLLKAPLVTIPYNQASKDLFLSSDGSNIYVELVGVDPNNGNKIAIYDAHSLSFKKVLTLDPGSSLVGVTDYDTILLHKILHQ